MTAFISMLISIIIWSSYPYIAVRALHTMTGLELIFFTTLVASISIFAISLVYFLRRHNLKTIIINHKKLSKSAWIAIFASGITHLMGNGLLFFALTMSNKAGVSLIYESWPIIAIIATPFFIKRKWKPVDLRDFIVSLIALLGVVIVVLSNKEINLSFTSSTNLNESIDYMASLGYILALIGGYSCALNIISKGVVAEAFKALNHDKGAIIISEFYSRTIALIVLLLLLPFFVDDIHVSNIQWSETIYIGFVVLILGGGFYTLSLINSDSPTIHVLYYFVPLIAVFILWYFGETTINTELILGGILIVISNLYLYFSGRIAEISEDL